MYTDMLLLSFSYPVKSVNPNKSNRNFIVYKNSF